MTHPASQRIVQLQYLSSDSALEKIVSPRFSSSWAWFAAVEVGI
jgi:hypothetical protein